MPVRSLNSCILKWPDAAEVDRALRRWVDAMVRGRQDLVRVGYFGSYARGDWGVGSDLDLVVVVEQSSEPFPRRAAQWDLTSLPVPAELLVYTNDEWNAIDPESRFGRILARETRWVYAVASSKGGP